MVIISIVETTTIKISTVVTIVTITCGSNIGGGTMPMIVIMTKCGSGVGDRDKGIDDNGGGSVTMVGGDDSDVGSGNKWWW